MAVVARLMDAAKAKRGIPSDNALGGALGRSREVVSQWRAGDAYPDEELIVAMAEMAGDDPGEWLVAVKAVRTDGPAKKAWEKIMKRLAATAALLLILIVPTVQETAYAREQFVQETHSSAMLNSNAEYTLCEMAKRLARSLLRWIARLVMGITNDAFALRA